MAVRVSRKLHAGILCIQPCCLIPLLDICSLGDLLPIKARYSLHRYHHAFYHSPLHPLTMAPPQMEPIACAASTTIPVNTMYCEGRLKSIRCTPHATQMLSACKEGVRSGLARRRRVVKLNMAPATYIQRKPSILAMICLAKPAVLGFDMTAG